MEVPEFLHDYGWAGVLIWMFYREVWPFIRGKLFPAYIEERKRLQKQQETDRRRLEDLEERQMRSFEIVANAVKAMEKILAVNTERLSVLQAGVNTLLDRQERIDAPKKG